MTDDSPVWELGCEGSKKQSYWESSRLLSVAAHAMQQGSQRNQLACKGTYQGSFLCWVCFVAHKAFWVASSCSMGVSLS